MFRLDVFIAFVKLVFKNIILYRSSSIKYDLCDNVALAFVEAE